MFGESDWALISRCGERPRIPVFGSGDCIEADQIVARLRDRGVGGVLIGRGALRNPWIFRQAADAAPGGLPYRCPSQERGQFLLDYLDLLLKSASTKARRFRHSAPGQSGQVEARTRAAASAGSSTSCAR